MVHEVRDAYGTVADQYIDLFGAVTHVHPDDLALIDRHLVGRAGPLLDVGCGPGHLTDHLQRLGADARGVDLVPEFVDHARATYPGGQFELGSMTRLPFAGESAVGILAWYSLIHLPPNDLDGVLAELRRVLIPGSTLVAGFFDGDEVGLFDHQVITAYRWPVDELSKRLRRAGFDEVERLQRPGIDEAGNRPHGAIAATAL